MKYREEKEKRMDTKEKLREGNEGEMQQKAIDTK